MIKKIKTFNRLSRRRKIMIVQTFGLSAYSWFLFSFFKRYARFGNKSAVVKPDSKFGEKAVDIAFAIKLVATKVPWKNVCRHHAYQAKLLCDLYKIPCLIFIGFKKDEEKNEIQAHSWTIAGGQIITGFCNPEEYIVQSIYRNKW